MAERPRPPGSRPRLGLAPRPMEPPSPETTLQATHLTHPGDVAAVSLVSEAINWDAALRGGNGEVTESFTAHA